MRPGGPILAALLLLTATAPLGVADDPLTADCGTAPAGVVMETLTLQRGDEAVVGCLATPDAGKASVTTLVVFAHGLGHTVQASWTGHMAETVQAQPGVAALAMNYRDNFGFPVQQGAEDLIAFTQHAQGELPNAETTILFGVSMGGAVSGTAIHVAPDVAGAGLFDHWFAVEGVSNLFETYTEARAVGLGVQFAADVADGIERDAGGTPAEAPAAYAHRSPALNADAMKAAGLQSAVVVHAVNDGLVPYDQGREMAKALRGAGVPVEMVTILRGAEDQNTGTTPTSHAIPPEHDPNEQHLHLAGHASEADGDHVVMRTALDRLFGLLRGVNVGCFYAEGVVDATGATLSCVLLGAPSPPQTT